MKLKPLVALSVALVLGLFVALAVTLIRTSDLLDLEARQLAESGESIRVAEQLKSRLLTHNRNAFLYSILQDPARRESRRAQTDELAALLERMQGLSSNEQERQLVRTLEERVAYYLDRRNELEASSLAPVEQYSEISQHVDDAIAVVEELIRLNLNQRDVLLVTVDRQNTGAARLGLLLLTLGGVLLLGLILLILAAVARPLGWLAAAIERYGAGDSAVRAQERGLAEIGQIAANFNSMADRLEERRQEQMQFIATIAHDLRNPLQSIAMASELLVLRTPEEHRELSRVIFRQVRDLGYLVDDLMDSSRAEAGQLDLELQDVDIAGLVRDATELQRSSTDLHAFVIAIESPLHCLGDRRQLSRVMNNLLSNAVKYSPNGGMVRVTAERRRGQLKIAVSDQGIGIDPSDYDNIFRPFYRTAATRRSIPGMGLGLAACRRIVEAHGGRLLVESVPGKGSTFTVVLPDAGPPEAATEGSQRPAQAERARLFEGRGDLKYHLVRT